MTGKSEYKTSVLHMFALNGFAIAQPLLDLLSGNVDFFVARGSQGIDLIGLLLLLVLGLPILAAVVYRVLCFVSARLMRIAHYGVLTALVAVTVLPLLKKFGLTDTTILASAVGIGFLFTFCYYSVRGIRMFVSALSPIPLIFAGLFLVGPAAREIFESGRASSPSEATLQSSDTPVVMLIFDEFALTALMDADRSIDGTLFPNFKRLADGASWYRNATTVATATMISVPAILTGNYPKEFVSQSYTNYPDTLFTLLADSHRMKVYESTTSLCSPQLCPNSIKLSKTFMSRIRFLLADISAVYLHIISPPAMSSRLPVVNMTWENYWQLQESDSWHRHNYGGRLEQLDFFINSISAEDVPGLYLMHTNFPHLPYQYLPSGNRYQGEWEVPGLDFSTDRWGDNPWLITQAYQRFMLQTATADKVIGNLIDHMQSAGVYERAMIVIVADHGVSFNANSQRRDAPPYDTLEKDVLPVPLFIKYPYQENGEISDENVETIDILPTIADVLGTGEELEMDGRSLLGGKAPRAEKLAFHAYKNFLQYRPDPGGELKYETLDWKLQNIGASMGVGGLYRIGKFPQLLDNTADDFELKETDQVNITLDTPGLFLDVDPGSGFIPSQITGSLQSDQPMPGADLAISINGVIRAVTETYAVQANGYRFSAMVPEQSFKPGENNISVYLVSSDNDGGLSLTATQGQLAEIKVGGNYSAWSVEANAIVGPGIEIPLLRDKLAGQLEFASLDDGAIELFGWAIDVDARDSVDRVVVFENDRYIYSNVTGMPRGEGTLHGAPDTILLGFQFVIPENLFHAVGKSEISLYAVSKHGYAAELKYFDGYPWVDQP